MTAKKNEQSGPFVRELLGRSDYRIISQLIEPNSRVLDLGCGPGRLAHVLVRTFDTVDADTHRFDAQLQ